MGWTMGCWAPLRNLAGRAGQIAPSPGRRVLLDHACVLQHVGPFAAGARVAVLEVLAEVVGTEELLAAVALPELVHLLQMPDSFLPILVCDVPMCRSAGRDTAPGEVLAAVAAGIRFAGPVCALVERPVECLERRAAPTMPPHVKAVLVALSLVLVLEAVAAEVALILLFLFVSSEFLGRLELLGLLRATFAHEEALYVSAAQLAALSEFPG